MSNHPLLEFCSFGFCLPHTRTVFLAWGLIKPVVRAIGASHTQLANISFEEILELTAVVFYFRNNVSCFRPERYNLVIVLL